VISVRSLLAVALAASPLVLTAACSSVQPGQASPATTPGTSAATGTGQSSAPREHSKAPPVKIPLDASKYIAAPCSSLTDAQLREFGGSAPGRLNSDESGPACNWDVGPNNDTLIGIGYLTSAKTGLTNLYALNDTGWWEHGYFEPTQLDGYPAAYASISDDRKAGACGITVGITDELMFSALVKSRPGNDSCSAAKNVASLVLKNIRGGS
jgi:hypothetical protein